MGLNTKAVQRVHQDIGVFLHLGGRAAFIFRLGRIEKVQRWVSIRRELLFGLGGKGCRSFAAGILVASRAAPAGAVAAGAAGAFAIALATLGGLEMGAEAELPTLEDTRSRLGLPGRRSSVTLYTLGGSGGRLGRGLRAGACTLTRPVSRSDTGIPRSRQPWLHRNRPGQSCRPMWGWL